VAKKPKILLIADDEAEVLDGLRIIFSRFVDEVRTAADGLEALAIVNAVDVTSVISDIRMPKLDGVGLIRELRERGVAVPVIFYTGHGHEELLRDVVKYGAFDFVDKPDLAGLEEVVHRALALAARGTDDAADLAAILEALQETK
jgi:two-component system response regulator AtoC